MLYLSAHTDTHIHTCIPTRLVQLTSTSLLVVPNGMVEINVSLKVFNCGFPPEWIGPISFEVYSYTFHHHWVRSTSLIILSLVILSNDEQLLSSSLYHNVYHFYLMYHFDCGFHNNIWCLYIEYIHAYC